MLRMRNRKRVRGGWGKRSSEEGSRVAIRTPLVALAVITLSVFMAGCATYMSQEVILCDPPQAEIYWGKSESSLQKTQLKTPNSRSISASKLERWCYQVKKEGYHDSEITCREEEGFRYLDFRLIPLKTTITSEPPEATIYFGAAKERLERTDYRTPRIITVKELPAGYGATWGVWCIQVKKEGFQDSETICSPRQTHDRTIHFVLRPSTR